MYILVFCYILKQNYREFRNTNFIRGRRDLLHLIRRKAQSSLRDIGFKESYTGPSSTRSKLADEEEVMEVDDDGSFEEGLTGASGTRVSYRKRTSTFKAAQASHQKSHLSPSKESQDQQSGPSCALNCEVYDDTAFSSSQTMHYTPVDANSQDLQWRLRQLETTNTLLMERYTSLANKHDELCNVIHSLFSSQLERHEATTKVCSFTIPSASVDAVLESRVRWNDNCVRRRRAYSDISNGGTESIIVSDNGNTSASSAGVDVRTTGSFDSTKCPDTDSEHLSESDGILGSKKAIAVEEPKKIKVEGVVVDEEGSIRSAGTEADDAVCTVADMCDSPTYHAANILVHSIHSNQQSGLAKDNGLASFVDAISTMWNNNNNTAVGLNKNSQSNPAPANVHGVSVQTKSFSHGSAALPSPIQVPKTFYTSNASNTRNGLVQSPLADHWIGVGGGYGNLAGKPITKQISLPASLHINNLGKKQKVIHSSHLASYPNSEQSSISGDSTHYESDQSRLLRALDGESLSRQNSF